MSVAASPAAIVCSSNRSKHRPTRPTRNTHRETTTSERVQRSTAQHVSARVRTSTHEYARVRASTHEYARVRTSTHAPGDSRPARPLRCLACCLETGVTNRHSMPEAGLKPRTLARPGSTTYLSMDNIQASNYNSNEWTARTTPTAPDATAQLRLHASFTGAQLLAMSKFD
jgi:hypothetical protein